MRGGATWAGMAPFSATDGGVHDSARPSGSQRTAAVTLPSGRDKGRDTLGHMRMACRSSPDVRK